MGCGQSKEKAPASTDHVPNTQEGGHQSTIVTAETVSEGAPPLQQSQPQLLHSAADLHSMQNTSDKGPTTPTPFDNNNTSTNNLSSNAASPSTTSSRMASAARPPPLPPAATATAVPSSSSISPSRARSRSGSSSFIRCEVASPVPHTRPPPLGSGGADRSLTASATNFESAPTASGGDAGANVVNIVVPSSAPRSRPTPLRASSSNRTAVATPREAPAPPSAAAAAQSLSSFNSWGPAVAPPSSRPPPINGSALSPSEVGKGRVGGTSKYGPTTATTATSSTSFVSPSHARGFGGWSSDAERYEYAAPPARRAARDTSRGGSVVVSRAATPRASDTAEPHKPQPFTNREQPMSAKTSTTTLQTVVTAVSTTRTTNVPSRRGTPTTRSGVSTPQPFPLPLPATAASSPTYVTDGTGRRSTSRPRTPAVTPPPQPLDHLPYLRNTNGIDDRGGPHHRVRSPPTIEEHWRLKDELLETRRTLDSVRQENIQLIKEVSLSAERQRSAAPSSWQGDYTALNSRSTNATTVNSSPQHHSTTSTTTYDPNTNSTFLNAREEDVLGTSVEGGGRRTRKGGEGADDEGYTTADSDGRVLLSDVFQNDKAFPNSAVREGRGLYGDLLPPTVGNASNILAVNTSSGTQAGGASAHMNSTFINAREQVVVESGVEDGNVSTAAIVYRNGKDSQGLVSSDATTAVRKGGMATPILHSLYTSPPRRGGGGELGGLLPSPSTTNDMLTTSSCMNSNSSSAVLSSRRHSVSDPLLADESVRRPPQTSSSSSPTREQRGRGTSSSNRDREREKAPRRADSPANTHHAHGVHSAKKGYASEVTTKSSSSPSPASTSRRRVRSSRKLVEKRLALPDGDESSVGTWGWWHGGGFDGASMVSNAPEAVEKLRSIRYTLEDQMEKDDSPVTLDMSHCAVFLEGCYSLATLLASRHVGLHMAAVTTLDFSNNPIGDEGVGIILGELSKAYRRNKVPPMPNVRKLSFSCCGIVSKVGAGHIAKHLFYNSDSSEGGGVVRKGLNTSRVGDAHSKTTKQQKSSRTDDADSGSSTVADSVFPCLELLDVGYNSLAPDAFRIIAEAMVSCRGASRTLLVVDFTECHLAPLTYVYVQDALKAISKINSTAVNTNEKNKASSHTVLSILPLRKIILAGHRFGYEADARLVSEAPDHLFLEMNPSPIDDASSFFSGGEFTSDEDETIRRRRRRRRLDEEEEDEDRSSSLGSPSRKRYVNDNQPARLAHSSVSSSRGKGASLAPPPSERRQKREDSFTNTTTQRTTRSVSSDDRHPPSKNHRRGASYAYSEARGDAHTQTGASERRRLSSSSPSRQRNEHEYARSPSATSSSFPQERERLPIMRAASAHTPRSTPMSGDSRASSYTNTPRDAAEGRRPQRSSSSLSSSTHDRPRFTGTTSATSSSVYRREDIVMSSTKSEAALPPMPRAGTPPTARNSGSSRGVPHAGGTSSTPLKTAARPPSSTNYGR